MARDLNELKHVLWDAFEEAHDRHNEYKDANGHYLADHDFKIQNRIALGTIAQAIVAVEAEERQQNEASGRRLGAR